MPRPSKKKIGRPRKSPPKIRKTLKEPRPKLARHTKGNGASGRIRVVHSPLPRPRSNGISQKKVAFDFKVPTNLATLEKVFGKFEWHDIENSRGADITIDPTWISDNLEKVILPGVLPKPVYIHHKIAPVFRAAIAEAAARCPDYKILSCASFVPRHKRHDIKAGLSLHSWAAAFDINPATNPYGAYLPIASKPKGEKPGIINIYYDLPETFTATLESYGFFWGKNFKGTNAKDPMHFQAAVGI